jgi:hypothetical protein
MDRNLESYVKIFRGVIDKKLCTKTLKLLKDDSIWHKHHYHNESTGEDLSYDDDLENTRGPIGNNEEMMAVIYDNIKRYITEVNLPWYNGWNGYSLVRYNRYKPGSNMKLHCDHINTLFDGRIRGIPTLTILGLLNDDFEGGEFTLFSENEDVIDLEKGDIIMFPSNFLYPHKVNSVAKGIRYSFVSWAW